MYKLYSYINKYSSELFDLKKNQRITWTLPVVTGLGFCFSVSPNTVLAAILRTWIGTASGKDMSCRSFSTRH